MADDEDGYLCSIPTCRKRHSGWWYMSFVEPDLVEPGDTTPGGSGFLGVTIVYGPSKIDAIDRAWDIGINPGGEVLCHPIDGEDDQFFAQWANRLLDNAECDALEASLRARRRA